MFVGIISIFGLPTKKWTGTMLKRRRTVVIVVGREGANATVVVCYDRRALRALLLSYERLKHNMSIFVLETK